MIQLQQDISNVESERKSNAKLNALSFGLMGKFHSQFITFHFRDFFKVTGILLFFIFFVSPKMLLAQYTPVQTLTGSPSINYVTKWYTGTAHYDITNSQIYDDGNKVGIGTTSPSALLHIESTGGYGGLCVAGTVGGSSSLGSGTRLMYIPASKGAFRAGSVNSTQWDAGNIGDGSWAGGIDCEASGDNSFAFGDGSVASATNSFAGGESSTVASATGAFAFGQGVTADGIYSMALGSFCSTSSTSDGSFVYGDYTTITPLVSTHINEFLVRASSGYIFYTDPSLTASKAVSISGSFTAGNLGIGTTAPLEKLEVYGRILIDGSSGAPSTTTDKLYNVSGNLFWNGINLTAGGALPTGTTGQTLAYNSGWVASSLIYNYSGQVGIGTTSPTSGTRLQIKGSGAGTNAGLDVINSSSVSNFTVLDNGAIGMGNSSPTSTTRLQIKGLGLSTNRTLDVQNSVGSPSLTALDNGTVSIGAFSGIGNTVLSIQGQGTTTAYSLGIINSGGSTLFTVRDDGLTTLNGDFTVNGTTTTLNSVLNVNGITTLTGDIIPSSTATYKCGTSTNGWSEVWVTAGSINTSDIRYKRNIEDLKYGLAEILKIKPIIFNWKESSMGGKKNLGFSAQELQQIIPEVVNDENKDRLGVYYSSIIPILVRGIQEQQTVINNQNTNIEIMQKQLAEMRECVTQLCNNENANNIIKLDKPQLYQNVPNPASGSTSISYYLPQNTKNATITIFDNKGVIISNFILNGNGSGNINFDLQKLSAGSYRFSLFVNETLIDSKQMVIVKN